MMKRSLFVSMTALLLAMLMLVGCSKQDPNAPDGYQVASNDKVSYTLFVPNDWVVDTEENSLVMSARVSAQESANISMMSYDNSSYPAETTAEGEEVSPVTRYWADNLDALSKLFDNDAEGNSTFKLETDGKTTLMGKTAAGKNVPAYAYVYTGTLGGVELKYMQVIACHKDVFYFLTFTASTTVYDQHIEKVEELLTYIVFD